jgi:hypothetical protein
MPGSVGPLLRTDDLACHQMTLGGEEWNRYPQIRLEQRLCSYRHIDDM